MGRKDDLKVRLLNVDSQSRQNQKIEYIAVNRAEKRVAVRVVFVAQ